MSSLSFKVSVDNAAQPVTQRLISQNLREMTVADRKALGNGPTITLLVGSTVIANAIPKRALMGLSGYFNDALVKHPRASKLILNPSEAKEDAVSTVIDYIVGNARVNTVFSLHVPKKFTAGIELYQTAIKFGMGSHANGLRRAILDELRNGDITEYAALDKLVKLPTTDACYAATVRKFEGLIFIHELDGDKDWATWLGEHPTFVARMEAWKKVRESKAAINREARRVARWEADFPRLA